MKIVYSNYLLLLPALLLFLKLGVLYIYMCSCVIKISTYMMNKFCYYILVFVFDR